MNSFGIVFDELQKSGLGIDIKRKGTDGSLIDAKPNELASLGTKSTVATTAGLLKKLSYEEKLAWAIETKNEANELFKDGKFHEAMGKYVESLAGSDFGSVGYDRPKIVNLDDDEEEEDNEATENTGNVDTLVVPVLCNLAACCIQVAEWGKAVNFADQAVLLRPHCAKAQMRKGIGLMRSGEHELALSSFELAQKHALQTDNKTGATPATLEDGGDEISTQLTEEHMVVSDHVPGTARRSASALELQIRELSDRDWQRLPQLIIQAKRGLQAHRKQLQQQRASLSKAFVKNSARQSSSESSFSTASTSAEKNKSETNMKRVSFDPNSKEAAKELLSTLTDSGSKNLENKEEIELMSLSELFSFFFSMFLDFWFHFLYALFPSSMGMKNKSKGD
jgi:tetratricopeptide (TPR) repeat protein